MKISIKLIFIFSLLLFAELANAQVGINTTTPQNDLDINGGLRVRSMNLGVNDDAKERLVATNTQGDLVNVTIDNVIDNSGIPRLAFNAKYGNGGSEFFNDCEPCADGTNLPLYLTNAQTNFLNTNIITIEDPSSIDGDEYFLVKESGLYRFEVNANLELTGTNRYFINVRLFVDRAVGPNDTDSIRAYAGQPAADNTNGISVPIYMTDLRQYEVGDKIYLSLVPALISETGLRRLKSTVATGATYLGQITVTKY